METLRVAQGECSYTCREKFYPDGSCEVLICDRPVFRPEGWESDKKAEKSSRGDSEPSGANIARAVRRAVGRLRDLALCNEFQCFVTLTLDRTKIDRYDDREVIKRMSTWADNKVRRDGLRYILVPERHKDGAIHFHGFMGWDSPINRTIWLRDSGTMTVPGRKAPVRVRSNRHRQSLTAQGGKVVYNLPKWTLGFTTAMDLYGEYHQAVTYVTKYIGKQVQGPEAGGKIGGRWFYHGGCAGEPEVKLSNQHIRDFEDYPGAYRFDVPEAGACFIRILIQGRKKDDLPK